MTTLTIMVSDANMLRIQEAFGIKGEPATVVKIQQIIKRYIRSRTLQYESAKASTEKYEAIVKEVW